jgi:hypothetical protein
MDKKLIDLYKLYRNNWTLIAKNMPGKKPNDISQRWLKVVGPSVQKKMQ